MLPGQATDAAGTSDRSDQCGADTPRGPMRCGHATDAAGTSDGGKQRRMLRRQATETDACCVGATRRIESVRFRRSYFILRGVTRRIENVQFLRSYFIQVRYLGMHGITHLSCSSSRSNRGKALAPDLQVSVTSLR
jgi:hypothetical protein